LQSTFFFYNTFVIFQQILRMIHLRLVEDKDTTFIEMVFRSTREKELRLTNWTELQKNAFIMMQSTAQHADYKRLFPDAFFGIIEYNKKPAGRLYTGETENKIHMLDLTLLPAFRGKGIGTKVFKNLMERASRQQKILSLDVEHGNPALQLYLRLGFKEIKNTGRHYYMEYTPISLR
jgi:ribosomal protein S18 acetylase RimI-like enzyme